MNRKVIHVQVAAFPSHLPFEPLEPVYKFDLVHWALI